MLLIAISIIGIVKLNAKKEIELKEEIYEIDKKQFSMYIENEEGNYEEYIESNKFPEGYQINIEKSKCVDTKGNVINGILTGNGTNITITSSKTSYCYLYFDIKELTASDYLIENVSSDMLWDSILEGDGYRYVGTNPDNYTCFGTTDKNECISDTDKYMYRIIGIFEDESGEQHLKLIKKEALNTSYMWHNDYSNDISWEDSDLYKGLNGSYFLTNPTYSYMQDSNWTDKISTWKWIATNTQTYYKYDSSSNSLIDNVGSSYYYSWPIGIYNSEHEIDTITGCYQTSSGSAINCKTTASYTYPEAKISLMHASDYALSLGEKAVSMTGSAYTNRSTLKTGWMHISNNDGETLAQYEWTSTRYGLDGDYYNVYLVSSNGYIEWWYVDNALLSRPVFYLTSDVTISGEGTIDNPYIITN